MVTDPAFNIRICESCEFWRRGLKLGACVNLRDDAGRVSTERLEKAVESGICPIGRFVEARLLEGLQ